MTKLPDPQRVAEEQESIRRAFLDAESRELLDYRERMVQARAKGRSPPRPLPRLDSPAPQGRTHLVIGDAHARPEPPDYSLCLNQRFDWLGSFIVEYKPDVIVDIGDWWGLDSLCHYDQGKKCFEGRRFHRDLEAGIDAQARVKAKIDGYNRGRRKKYQPEMHRMLGNHENRINRVIELEPRFEGVIGTEDLESAQYDWIEHPFLEPFVIDGVTYCHYAKARGSERAVSGVMPARAVAMARKRSYVFGHSHRLSWYLEPENNVSVLNCGCYFTHWEDYGGDDNLGWSRGLALLKDVRDGRFDLQWHGLEAIQRRYA